MNRLNTIIPLSISITNYYYLLNKTNGNNNYIIYNEEIKNI